MNTKEFFTQLLKLDKPWKVERVEQAKDTEHVQVYLKYDSREWIDEESGEVIPVYDFREERTWRHLNTMQYETHIHCRTPRIKTSEGKIASCPVPWGDEGQRHTYRFEDNAIATLQATHNQTQAGKLLAISYEKMTRIMQRSVDRGLQRRDLEKDNIVSIHIDEKSYKKGHHYVTVLSDSKGKRILNIEKERTAAACEKLLSDTFSEERLKKLEAVCMDMWEPFMLAAKKNAPKPSWCTTSFT